MNGRERDEKRKLFLLMYRNHLNQHNDEDAEIALDAVNVRVANDEFNIKMRIFLFVVFGRVCFIPRSMQYRVRTANKFERRYEKS